MPRCITAHKYISTLYILTHTLSLDCSHVQAWSQKKLTEESASVCKRAYHLWST
jgi:hypothetical protein